MLYNNKKEILKKAVLTYIGISFINHELSQELQETQLLALKAYIYGIIPYYGLESFEFDNHEPVRVQFIIGQNDWKPEYINLFMALADNFVQNKSV